MSLTLTLILLAASLAVAALSAWRGAQPPDPARGPRMVPWRFLMIAGAALALLLSVHLFGLLMGGGPA